jgi:predicted enzyme related to lactoylglutathione lyase
MTSEECTDMELQVLFASMPVSELSRSVEWYERFFGRPFDIDINPREVMWRINDGAWLYLIVDNAAGRGGVAISVADLEAAVGELRQRDIEAGDIKPEGDAAFKSVLIDPDGNRIELLKVG